jgi:hypothetical protein
MNLRISQWLPVVVAMPLYSLIKYGPTVTPDTLVVSFIAQTISFGLAIYLYYGIARLNREGCQFQLWIGLALGVVSGFLLVGTRELWMLTTDWSMLFAASAIVGGMTKSNRSPFVAFMAGLIIVILVGIASFLPVWSDMRIVAEKMSQTIAYDFKNSAVGLSLDAQSVETYSAIIQKWANVVVRLLPTILVMSFVTQFTIGYLWFAEKDARTHNTDSPLKSFLYWRVPLWVTLVVAIAVASRFLAGETAGYFSDNLLAAASLFYCVTGLALVEYYMRKFKLHWSLRLLFYILMVPTGLIGYFVFVLFGLMTSVYDWRSAPEVVVE